MLIHTQLLKNTRVLFAGFVAVALLAVVATVMFPGKSLAAPSLQNLQDIHYIAQAANACADAQCILDKYVNPAIKVLTACVGVAVVISIIVGGIQYSSAGGDPSKVGAAKGRIAKAIGALVMYIFLYAFLNYIIPGGVK